MSYSLNSLKGGYIGDYIGEYYRDYKGDTRSLDLHSLGFRRHSGQCERSGSISSPLVSQKLLHSRTLLCVALYDKRAIRICPLTWQDL